MERIDTKTADITAENKMRLLELFPQVATEIEDEKGDVKQAVDLDALRELLGDVAEGQRERYQFTWPGKSRAKTEIRKSALDVLLPDYDSSVDWENTQNLYIEGDNLTALKLLRETYAGKIKLIYIDPPYNTGHDFIYNDDFAQAASDYAEANGEFSEVGEKLVANPTSNGRFHSDWCTMIYSRLSLARDLMSKDGALFISIDDNEETNLMKICGEIFGSENFVAKLSVQVNPRGRNLDRYIAKTIEPVLVWVKDYESVTCINPIDKDERMLSEYNREDSKGKYRPIGLRNRNQRFNPQTRPNLYFPLWICPEDGTVSIEQDSRHTIERLPLAGDGSPTCWTWSRDKIVNENEYIFGEQSGDGWRVFRKDYLSEGSSSTTLAKSLQADAEFNNDYGKKRIKELFGANVMSFPKSPYLMKRIVEMGSSKDSFVLDFFSGSATMADAVMQQNALDGGNRKFIMIQLPEETEEGSDAFVMGLKTICEIGEERIRRAGAKIREEVEEANRQLRLGEEPRPVPDTGFRVLRIDSSNFRDAKSAPDGYDQATIFDYADNLKEGRTPLDILFQVLPAFRIPYSAKIDEVEVAGKQAFVVNDGQLVACFDEDLTNGCIEEIARMEPVYAVFRDASLADDATAANLEELFKTYSPDTVRRVI